MLNNERLYQICKMGEGTFGTVYQAFDKKLQRKVAIKQLKQSEQREGGIDQTIIREISILKSLNCKHITNLLEVQSNQGSIYLILEFIEGDLRRLIDSSFEMNEEIIKRISNQLLVAIQECHKIRIMHRDLKPQNILIDDNLQVKVCDFGLAKMFSFPMCSFTPHVASLWYKAPEVLLGLKNQDTSMDIWSIGLIIVELVLRRPLLMGKSEFDQIVKTFSLFGTPKYDSIMQRQQSDRYPQFKGSLETLTGLLKGKVSKEGVDLMMGMLKMNHEQRFDAEKCLKHPWFNSLLVN